MCSGGRFPTAATVGSMRQVFPGLFPELQEEERDCGRQIECHGLCGVHVNGGHAWEFALLKLLKYALVVFAVCAGEVLASVVKSKLH